jgi:hypothetical protein
VALAFVIRSEALKNAGDKQAALEASARAFSCMCGVERAHTQLTIFDQLGWLLLDSGHARKAIPILEAAVGLGIVHKRRRSPPQAGWNAPQWRASAWASMRMRRLRLAKRSI